MNPANLKPSSSIETEDDEQNETTKRNGKYACKEQVTDTAAVGSNPKAKAPTATHKRPRDMPSRPLNAYNYFFSEQRNLMVAERQSQSSTDRGSGSNFFSSMGKTVASRWKKLSGKEMDRFKALAAADKQRYREEMDEYNQRVMKRMTATFEAQLSKGQNSKVPPLEASNTAAVMSPASTSLRNSDIPTCGRIDLVPRDHGTLPTSAEPNSNSNYASMPPPLQSQSSNETNMTAKISEYLSRLQEARSSSRKQSSEHESLLREIISIAQQEEQQLQEASIRLNMLSEAVLRQRQKEADSQSISSAESTSPSIEQERQQRCFRPAQAECELVPDAIARVVPSSQQTISQHNVAHQDNLSFPHLPMQLNGSVSHFWPHLRRQQQEQLQQQQALPNDMMLQVIIQQLHQAPTSGMSALEALLEQLQNNSGHDRR